MSKPIAIPLSRELDIDMFDDYSTLNMNRRSYSNESDISQYRQAVMIYPGFYPQAPGIITPVTTNYNSYNTLCSMIGRHPISTSLQYIPYDSIKITVDSLLDADMFTLENEFNSTLKLEPLSYFYTLYYDSDAQTNKKPSEFNQIISHFTKRQFWGRVIVIDENPGHPVINKLDQNVDKHSL
jgi:hypothetical protein